MNSSPGLAGHGKAQSPLPLQHGVTYYSKLRAITNGDNVLESTSNGFTVDITPPEIVITDLGEYDARVDLVSGVLPLFITGMLDLGLNSENNECRSNVLVWS